MGRRPDQAGGNRMRCFAAMRPTSRTRPPDRDSIARAPFLALVPHQHVTSPYVTSPSRRRDHMLRRVVVASLAVAFGAVAVTERADAVPSFTRQTGMTCAQWHVMFGAPVPNFTFTGKKFRMNGYRVPFVTDKIEAGEVGSLGGKRLAMSLFPYLSLRYQSVFAQQSKLPGAAEAQPITSNPTSRLAFFTGGPIGDHFGLWTELYLTPDGSDQNREWTFGVFSFDEYDLRFVQTSGNNVFGVAFNNQGISEVSGFGPWPVSVPQEHNRGGYQGWSHPNRGNVLAYAWLNDKVLL